MPGYRESSFDPMASPRYGRPLRPFNWVQWTGVAFDVIGIAFYTAYLAGQAGWIPQKLSSPMFGFPFIILAIPLINSRREVIADPAPELAEARKRWLIIVTILSVVVLGAATIIAFVRS